MQNALLSSSEDSSVKRRGKSPDMTPVYCAEMQMTITSN